MRQEARKNMKITYITHSSILIETEDAKVISDPWYFGPAYLNHWHVFPKPIDISYAKDVTHIIITHGHEDHCHFPTLRQLNTNAKVLLPYTWLAGLKEAFKETGFIDVVEVDSYQTITIGKYLKLTFIVNGLDSIFVLDYKGQIYVNLNDAFNATHLNFLKLFSKRLKMKWPKIDYLMCGVGGAGYFPNTIHSRFKNDKEIGILREQFLMKLFCEFVVAFSPKIAIPFLPGFALVEKDKLWINQIRQPRYLIEEYYSQLKSDNQVEFWNMYPGDYIHQDVWNKTSPYYKMVVNDDWGSFTNIQLAQEIKSKANQKIESTRFSIEKIADKLNALFAISCKGIEVKTLAKLDFVIELSDINRAKIFVCYLNGKVQASINKQPYSNPHLIVKTTSANLVYSIEELWGGDVFFIGYGADIEILNPDCIKDNLDILSLRILSVFPTAKQHLKKNPWRAFRYFFFNRLAVTLALKQKFLLRKNINKLPFNERSHWIQTSKCETCLVCDVPLLSNALAENLVTNKLN